MKTIFYIHVVAIAASLFLISCNESRRGNAGFFSEDGDKAAAGSRKDEYDHKKQRDSEFVFETVANQYGEIKLAELAIQRSHTPAIKKLAEQMQTDHSATLNELKMLAQAKAISVPVEETDASKRELEKIADESGTEFDEQWCAQMIDMHEESIEKFEKRLDDTEDSDLKTYIAKTLAVLKDHRESLKRYRGKSDNRNS